MLQVGQVVPDFSLTSSEGGVSRQALLGTRYVLYFYPKDDTTGCTKEACGFRDQLVRFDANQIKVFGVSADDLDSHAKFIKKYALSFPLIADPERQLIQALGLWVEKSMYGKKYMGIARSTFVIDAEGKIERVWDKVNVDTHASDVLAYLNGESPAADTSKAANKIADAKKAVAKKPAGKKALTKKAPAKKVVAKKVVAKKAVVKKASTNKAAVQKMPAPTKKAPAKKAPAKKAPAKKAPGKPAAAKKTTKKTK